MVLLSLLMLLLLLLLLLLFLLLLLLLISLQVVSGAARALCALARLSPAAGQRLAALMTRYMAALKQTYPQLLNPPAEPAVCRANQGYTSR